MSSQRDCSGIGFDDVLPLEATGAGRHRSFAAYQSRSRVARIEDLSAGGERSASRLWRPAVRAINGYNEVATNSDGSVDLWFAAEKPTDVPQSNWIQIVSGRNFLIALRLYGTGVEFFDQTWKPDDVVKVK